MGTITEAWAGAVHYGDIEAAFQRAYVGTPLVRWQEIHDGKPSNLDCVVWQGHNIVKRSPVTNVVGGKAGHFWAPNPYLVEGVRRAAAGQTGGLDAVFKRRTGLTERDIARLCWLVVENDKASLEEQAVALDALSSALGTPWSLVVCSGDTRPASLAAAGLETAQQGKSFHAYLALESESTDNLDSWVEASTLLTLLIGGDRAMTRPGQACRYPGSIGTWEGTTRVQTLLHQDMTYRWKLSDLVPKLRAIAEARGIVVADAIEAMRLAEAFERDGDKTRAKRLASTLRADDGDRQAASKLRRVQKGFQLDPQTMVYCEGRRVSLQSMIDNLPADTWHECQCPLHPERSSHTAGLIHGNRGAGVKCWSDHHYYPIGEKGDLDLSGFDVVDHVPCSTPKRDTARVEYGNELTSEGGGVRNESSREELSFRAPPPSKRVTHLYERHLTGGRFIPFQTSPAKVLGIKAPKGTGKSYFLKQLVDKTMAHGAVAVVDTQAQWLTQAIERATEDLYDVANAPAYNDETAAVAEELQRKAIEALSTAHAKLAHHMQHAPRVGMPRVVAITHRRSLARMLANSLGIDDYQDSTGALVGSCVVCVDSLHRLDLSGGVDLLVLDESEQVLRHLVSGTLKGSQAVVAEMAIAKLMILARQVVVADADLGALTQEYIKNVIPQASTELRIVHVEEPWTYQLSNKRADVVAAMKADWLAGKKLAIAVFAHKYADTLGKLLQSWAPGRKVAVIHRDSYLDKKLEISADPNGWAAKYDAIIYSPTLGTGISFDQLGLVDKVYGFGFSNVGTAQDLDQMLRRFRHPTDPQFTVWLDSRSEGLTTNKVMIESQLNGLSELTADWLKSISLEWAGIAAPLSPRLFKLKVDVTAWERRQGARGGSLDRAFRFMVDGRCTELAPVSKVEATELNRAIKAARKEAQVEYNEAVIAAPDRDPNDPAEPKTTADAHAVTKARVLEDWGSVTPETIAIDAGGKLRGKAAAFTRVMLLLQDNVEAALAADRFEYTRGSPSHAQFRGIQANTTIKLLALAGIDLVAISEAAAKDQVTMLDTTKFTTALEAAEAWRNEPEMVGFSIPSLKVKGRAGMFVSSLLNKLGLELEYDYVRVGGGKREYRNHRISLSSLLRVYTLAPRFVQKWNDEADKTVDILPVGVDAVSQVNVERLEQILTCWSVQ